MLIPKPFFFLIFDPFFALPEMLTPLNHKGPPYGKIYKKNVRKLFLIAQKKRPDALNAAQKP